MVPRSATAPPRSSPLAGTPRERSGGPERPSVSTVSGATSLAFDHAADGPGAGSQREAATKCRAGGFAGSSAPARARSLEVSKRASFNRSRRLPSKGLANRRPFQTAGLSKRLESAATFDQSRPGSAYPDSGNCMLERATMDSLVVTKAAQHN